MYRQLEQEKKQQYEINYGYMNWSMLYLHAPCHINNKRIFYKRLVSMLNEKRDVFYSNTRASIMPIIGARSSASHMITSLWKEPIERPSAS